MSDFAGESSHEPEKVAITRARLAELEDAERRYRELQSKQSALSVTARLTGSIHETVFNSMVQSVIVIEPTGNVLAMNQAARQLFPSPHELPFQTMAQMFEHFTYTYPDGSPCPPEEWPIVCAASGSPVVMRELTIRNTDNGHTWIGIFNAAPVRDANGEIVMAFDTTVDVTEQRRLAEEMHVSGMQIELQRLLLQDRENERVRIAQELHDGPLQEMLGLEYDLTDALRIDNRHERLQMLDRLRQNLRQSTRTLRAFCADLRPPSLAAFGLEKAIRSHLEQLEQANPRLHCSVELMPDEQTLTVETRMTLFRIYQELMTNVVRHSKASEVRISLTLDEAQIELEIEDDGHGFQPPAHWIELARNDHFGLVGVQERASAVGGRVVLRTQPGAGTLVRVIVPRSLEITDKPIHEG